MSPEEVGGSRRHAVRVVCPPGLGAGFELAGLRAVEVEPGAGAERELERIRSERGVGVVLVEEAIHEALSEELLDAFAREPLPVLVPFPGPVWKERPPAGAYLLELLRRAVGYRVRLG